MKTAGEYAAESMAMEAAGIRPEQLRPSRIEHYFQNLQQDSAQSIRIIGISKEVVELFREKNRDYGDTSHTLGVKGQFADIWRKVGKLKRALWDDQDMLFESVEEMLFDLIGHCLLTVDFLREQRKKEPPALWHISDECAEESLARLSKLAGEPLTIYQGSPDRNRHSDATHGVGRHAR